MNGGLPVGRMATSRVFVNGLSEGERENVTGIFTSGRATRNMDRLAIRKDGDALFVDLSHIIKSDVDPSGWAAAVIPA